MAQIIVNANSFQGLNIPNSDATTNSGSSAPSSDNIIEKLNLLIAKLNSMSETLSENADSQKIREISADIKTLQSEHAQILTKIQGDKDSTISKIDESRSIVINQIASQANIILQRLTAIEESGLSNLDFEEVTSTNQINNRFEIN